MQLSRFGWMSRGEDSAQVLEDACLRPVQLVGLEGWTMRRLQEALP